MKQEACVPPIDKVQASEVISPNHLNPIARRKRAVRRMLGTAAAVAVSSLAAAAPAEATSSGRPIIVVVGDSLGVGAMPVGATGYVASEGYAGRVAKANHARLADFACAGATTSSALYGGNCTTIGMKSYGGGSQVDAAERFIRQHKGQVVEEIVELGINDGLDPSTTPRLQANINLIARGLRDATAHSNRKVKFVGVTYEDPLLPAWLAGDPTSQTMAKNSVALVRDGLNAPLASVYRQNHYAVADFGKAFGNYLPFNQTVSLAGNSVPEAVADACAYTYGCDARSDIHFKTAGYERAAVAIEAAR